MDSKPLYATTDEIASMKVPPKRKGNATLTSSARPTPNFASMKVPPKRKGNFLALFMRSSSSR